MSNVDDAERRKPRWSHPKFQRRFILLASFASICVSIVAFVMFWYLEQEILKSLRSLGLNQDYPQYQHIELSLQWGLAALGICSTVFNAVIFYTAWIVSQKIVGPMNMLRQVIDGLADERTDQIRFKFRSHDAFPDLAESLERLEKKIKEAKK